MYHESQRWVPILLDYLVHIFFIIFKSRVLSVVEFLTKINFFLFLIFLRCSKSLTLSKFLRGNLQA